MRSLVASCLGCYGLIVFKKLSLKSFGTAPCFGKADTLDLMKIYEDLRNF
jgi:hypothetical protein